MLSHLLELRRRIIYILVCCGILFLFFFFLAEDLFQGLVAPLIHSLPNHEGIIATHITSPVFTPLKLAVNAAFFCSTPFALYQFWIFVSPGLYQQEKNLLRGTLVLSLLLFTAGALFCFYLVLPFMFQLFAHALPKGVRFLPDMTYAIDFITRMMVLFGLSFQVPLICLILVRCAVVDINTLKQIRPYIIVGAFTLGMLLTPPDVFSQVMLALPLCLLYEFGIVLASCSFFSSCKTS